MPLKCTLWSMNLNYWRALLLVYLFVWAKWSVGVPTAVDFLRREE